MSLGDATKWNFFSLFSSAQRFAICGVAVSSYLSIFYGLEGSAGNEFWFRLRFDFMLRKSKIKRTENKFCGVLEMYLGDEKLKFILLS